MLFEASRELFAEDIAPIEVLPKAKRQKALFDQFVRFSTSVEYGLKEYNGTKGAAVTLTKSMAVELAGQGVRVNAVNPVIGETGLTVEFMGGVDSPEIREKFISSIPLGRMSTPLDIANAALFLASDEAALVTGVCMEVDGGRCV